jgi:poly(hydroxyalkanoate) depolymerase family esterase
MKSRFPEFDMAGAIRLTRQGRLKEAVAALRGKTGAAAPVAAAAPADGVSQFVDEALRMFKMPAAPVQAASQPRPGPAGGRFETRSFSNAAGTRNYKIFVPGSDRGQAMPLLVMLHGCTQSPDDFAAGTGMNDLAEEQGFLVAYPEQARTANVSKCWNWFAPGNQQRDQGEASLIAGITQRVMHDFAVLPGRVYVAGLSAGGALAAIMGAAYPELYAGIGVHSGLARGAASDMGSAMTAMRQGAAAPALPDRLIPTIVFHGDRDTTVNIANAAQVIAQARGKADLREMVLEGEAGGRRYTRKVLSAVPRGPLLEEWVLHGAGHAWSGGRNAGSFTDPQGPDASREMMRFFLSLPV